jgi:hypothetical protein
MVSAFMALAAGLASASAAPAQAPAPIQVVSALYGAPNAARPVNFTARLRETCGEYASDCQAFCSNAFVGRGERAHLLPFGPRPICRVTYRCGAQATLVTDAERNDYMVLSCRSRP